MRRKLSARQGGCESTNSEFPVLVSFSPSYDQSLVSPASPGFVLGQLKKAAYLAEYFAINIIHINLIN